jgi:uncharacterized protein (TIGR03435 family)
VRTFLSASLPLCVVIALGAQDGPRFDAVSVKRNLSNVPGNSLSSSGGRLAARNVNVALLLGVAYGFNDPQVINAPGWFTSERFDITATIPGGPVTPLQRSAMVRAMLEDRFRLVTHQETREFPIYHLVVARSDGRLGPDIRKSTLDCAAYMKEQRANPVPPPAQPQAGDVWRCSPRATLDASRVTTMNVEGVTISALVFLLGQSVSRPLFDKTGLEGGYDFRLRFLPEPGSFAGSRGNPGNPLANPTPGPPANEAPTIFTAVQEQLGLKLEPLRGPLDVLVIDRAERPTED